MNIKAVLLKILVALIFLSFLGCGNSALHWIKDGGKIRVQGSEKVIPQDLHIENITRPKQSTPIIFIQIHQIDSISSPHYYKLVEVKKEWSIPLKQHLLRWTVGWLILTPLWSYFLTPPGLEDEIESAPTTLRGKIEVVAGKTGTYPVEWYPTGKSKDGEMKTEKSEMNSQLKSQKLLVSISKFQKEYTTDSNGEIRVDLLRDFNLIKVENDIPIQMSISNPLNGLSTTLTVKPSNWMVKYVKIKGNELDILGEEGNKTVVLGRANEGEEYKFLHEGEELWLIDYNGKQGFINPKVGKIFWAVENYLELNK